MALSRSEQMARIRGRDTRPELLLRAELAVSGIACDPHQRLVGSRPDLVLTDAQVAVFVDGCFWHGCPDHYVRPRSRTEYWSERLRTNVERDQRQTRSLEVAGWRVLRFWEHEVFEATEVCVAAVATATTGASSRAPPCWRVLSVTVIDAATDLECQCLVDLFDPGVRRDVVRVRSTRKWAARRPSAAP